MKQLNTANSQCSFQNPFTLIQAIKQLVNDLFSTITTNLNPVNILGAIWNFLVSFVTAPFKTIYYILFDVIEAIKYFMILCGIDSFEFNNFVVEEITTTGWIY